MPASFRWILGIKFYCGDITGLINLTRKGGLVVVPAAPALVDLPSDHAYRTALEQSEFAITDSAFMVWLWSIRHGEILQRISGLQYLRTLLNFPEFRAKNATFWVMPSIADAEANMQWLKQQGLDITGDHCYLAPKYPPGTLTDPDLLSQINATKPRYVVINLGGGVQERLGHYLSSSLSYRPAIICTGAAIAFLSGRQVCIPKWADRFFLGWLFRCLHEPSKFVPRYWKAVRLAPLLWKFDSRRITPQ